MSTLIGVFKKKKKKTLIIIIVIIHVSGAHSLNRKLN